MTGLRAFIVGSTGQVGMALVKALAEDPRYDSVKLIQRRQTQVDYGPGAIDVSKRFSQHVVDFDNLQNHADLFADTDIGFCALGTTLKASGKERMRIIDHDYVIQIAKLCCSAGCKEFHVVSSRGANPKSYFFYPKLKGETETDLQTACTFPNYLAIYRPALLICDRTESRPAERVFQYLCKSIDAIAPTSLSVPVQIVAKAMANAPFHIQSLMPVATKDEGKVTDAKVYIVPNAKLFELASQSQT